MPDSPCRENWLASPVFRVRMRDLAIARWSGNVMRSCWLREPIVLQGLTLRNAAYILRCKQSNPEENDHETPASASRDLRDSRRGDVRHRRPESTATEPSATG